MKVVQILGIVAVLVIAWFAPEPAMNGKTEILATGTEQTFVMFDGNRQGSVSSEALADTGRTQDGQSSNLSREVTP